MHPELDGGSKTKEERWRFLSQVFAGMCGLFYVIVGLGQLSSNSEYRLAGILLLGVGIALLAQKSWAALTGGVLAVVVGANYLVDLAHDANHAMVGLIIMLAGIGMVVSGIKMRKRP